MFLDLDHLWPKMSTFWNYFLTWGGGPGGGGAGRIRATTYCDKIWPFFLWKPDLNKDGFQNRNIYPLLLLYLFNLLTRFLFFYDIHKITLDVQAKRQG